MNRRQFVNALGQGSLATMIGLNASRLWAQTSGHELPVNCSPPAHGTAKHITFNTSINVTPRKSVWDLSSAEVTRLQSAYAALRNLTITSPNDPRGWMQQANVHCFNCSGGYDPSNVEIHGGWWFLPWHRCYLHVHERILGKLIGDPTFRLAYWDWDTYPSHAIVPPPFWTGSLSNPYRGVLATDQIPSGISGPARMNIVLGTHNTAVFMGGPSDPAHNVFPSGVLENNPHGPVHIWTGDPEETGGPTRPSPAGCFYPTDEGGPVIDQSQVPPPAGPNGCLDMGVLATAAQDPLFFAHHSNIDRLWDVWLNTPGSKGNWTKPNWLSHPFTFYDENRNWIYITVADVLAQEEQNNLRYAYQPPQGGTPFMAQAKPRQVQGRRLRVVKPLVVASSVKAIPIGTKPHVKSVAVPTEHKRNLSALAAGSAGNYLLHIDGLTLPPGQSTILDVYAGDPNANLDTEVGPSFVGTFSIVASGPRHMHATVRNAVFELRPETAALLATQKNLTVTLVPKLVNGKEPKASNLSYKRIYLSTE